MSSPEIIIRRSNSVIIISSISDSDTEDKPKCLQCNKQKHRKRNSTKENEPEYLNQTRQFSPDKINNNYTDINENSMVQESLDGRFINKRKRMPRRFTIVKFKATPSKINISEEEKLKAELVREEKLFNEEDSTISCNKPMILDAGKAWRRSLAKFRRETIDKHSSDTHDTYNLRSRRIIKTPVRYRQSIGEGYEQRLRESLQLEKLIEDLSLNVTEKNLSQSKRSARNLVLQRCGQTAPLNFSKCYPQSLLQNCHKIGEGVYGEVFLYRNPVGGLTVMKIIPIEGEMLVNGEKQKQYEEIISEIIIASELSNLRNNPINKTAAFNEVQQIKLVQGKYPDTLLDLWDLYNESKVSENDNPEDFGEDQLYIVLELAYGGLDLEQFNFTNFCEVYHCFIQIILGLAIAEQELQFEHRDLHWGNVLIAKTAKNAKCSFNIDGTMITMPTHGVVATIIDFTLSRVTHNDCCIYNDLSQDPDLFTAEGDYQFDIYRQMQSNNRNDWEAFNPYSNLLWLHYLLVKMTTSVNLSKKKISTKDKVYFNNLIEWEKCLLNYKSTKQFVFEALLPKLKEKENKKL